MQLETLAWWDQRRWREEKLDELACNRNGWKHRRRAVLDALLVRTRSRQKQITQYAHSAIRQAALASSSRVILSRLVVLFYFGNGYLLTHTLQEGLAAAEECRQHEARQGVLVDGYIQWTISDNWEWADGYCPKFGLVDVDRADNLTCIPCPSYYLYQQVCKTGLIKASQREEQWRTVREAVSKDEVCPFCRVADSHGRMWAGKPVGRGQGKGRGRGRGR